MGPPRISFIYSLYSIDSRTYRYSRNRSGSSLYVRVRAAVRSIPLWHAMHFLSRSRRRPFYASEFEIFTLSSSSVVSATAIARHSVRPSSRGRSFLSHPCGPVYGPNCFPVPGDFLRVVTSPPSAIYSFRRRASEPGAGGALQWHFCTHITVGLM